MEITYTMQGDYLLPNLTLPEQDNRRQRRRLHGATQSVQSNALGTQEK